MATNKILAAMLAGLIVWGVQPPAQAQVRDRTIAEIKTESQARAERGAYPLGGLDPQDVRDALALVNSRDPDEWAAGWGLAPHPVRRRAAVSESRRSLDFITRSYYIFIRGR